MKTLTQIRWGWIILGIIAGKFLLYALDYIFMLIYSLAVNPGHPESFYQDYIFDNRFWINSINGAMVLLLLTW